VLLFAGGQKVDIKFADIINGSFTACPNVGTATALVFLMATIIIIRNAFYPRVGFASSWNPGLWRYNNHQIYPL